MFQRWLHWAMHGVILPQGVAQNSAMLLYQLQVIDGLDADIIPICKVVIISDCVKEWKRKQSRRRDQESREPRTDADVSTETSVTLWKQAVGALDLILISRDLRRRRASHLSDNPDLLLIRLESKSASSQLL